MMTISRRDGYLQLPGAAQDLPSRVTTSLKAQFVRPLVIMEADSSQHPRYSAATSLPPSKKIEAASLRSLNLDVFRLILGCLPRAELLQLSYASRFVREEASRELLAQPVKLLRRKRLQSFCRFALSGDPAKLSYLRSLAIQHIDEPLDEEQKQDLISVLRRSVNLAELHLQWCDVLLTGDPRIPEAISLLPSLAMFNVWMYQAEDTTLQAILRRMLMNMKHPLRRLYFPLSLRGDSLPAFLQEVASAHGGLEDFFIGFYDFVAPMGMSLPHVHTLRLLLEGTTPPLADLYAIFPHVRDLHITSHVHSGLPSLSFQDIDSERPGGTLRSERSMWPSLNSLTTTIGVIYGLGLDCPVRALDVSFYEREYHNNIAEVVSRLRPRKLNLDLFCSPDWEPPRAEPCLLLYNSGKAGVRHLFLKISYSVAYSPETRHVLNNLQPLLSASHVELLHFAMAEYFHSNDSEEIVAGPPYKSISQDGSEHRLTVDADAIARALAEICTSLRCIAITIAQVGHAVWRVDRTNGGVEVVKLGSYEGRRLLEREAKVCLEC
ncbi:hypothetical protein BV20DRAFT_1028309 [Pilatotrama ljubarskyi]|nr:hypothetical protein BV20DRAFT_1028309 [Pilatotrama ljubarskyi]